MATEINFEEIINQLRDILKAELQNDWDIVKETGEEYLNDTELRLELYAESALTGEISPAFLLNMLQEEKNILESQLLSLEVIGKAQANNAITKVFAAIGAWVFTHLVTIIFKI